MNCEICKKPGTPRHVVEVGRYQFSDLCDGCFEFLGNASSIECNGLAFAAKNAAFTVELGEITGNKKYHVAHITSDDHGHIGVKFWSYRYRCWRYEYITADDVGYWLDKGRIEQ